MKRRFYKYFIPNAKNDYKPHFFREKIVSVLFLAIFLLFAFSFAQRFIIKEVNFASVISSVLIDLANRDRQNNDAPPLALNPLLVQAAQAKANDMAAKGYFAHTSPEGLSPWHWFKAAGYEFVYAGENLAVNFSDSEDVERAWMNSQTHRANILNPRFTEIGIALAKGVYKNQEAIFVVQMFGRPAPAPKPSLILPLPPNKEPASAAIEDKSVAGATSDYQESAAAPRKEGEKTGRETSEKDLETVAAEDMFMAVKNNDYDEPAAIQRQGNEVMARGVSYASFLNELAVSPKKFLFYSYALIGLFILLALGLFVFIEIRIQHHLNIFYALCLIAFMAGLLYLSNTYFTTGILIR